MILIEKRKAGAGKMIIHCSISRCYYNSKKYFSRQDYGRCKRKKSLTVGLTGCLDCCLMSDDYIEKKRLQELSK